MNKLFEALDGERPYFGRSLSYWLNAAALVAVCGSLLEALFWQFAFNELPCPLCQLQRVALTLAGIGMMLNVRFGPHATHYAIILASAIGGATASVRQVLLHIAPGDPGYGSTLFGLHFYTWGFISFLIMMLFCVLMLCLDRDQLQRSKVAAASAVSTFLIGLFFAIAAANTLSAVAVCGFGPCPDNPTQYIWQK
jgi:disulfide bond formation protein DsbB